MKAGPLKVGAWMVAVAAAVVAAAAWADVLGDARKYVVAFGMVWGLIGCGIVFNGVVDRWAERGSHE